MNLFTGLMLLSLILLMFIILTILGWQKNDRPKNASGPESTINPRAAARHLMKEMGLNYVGVNYRALPGDSRIVISRYACQCNGFSAAEVKAKPIPADFIDAIRALFPGRQVVVNERVITQADLDAERKIFSAEG